MGLQKCRCCRAYPSQDRSRPYTPYRKRSGYQTSAIPSYEYGKLAFSGSVLGALSPTSSLEDQFMQWDAQDRVSPHPWRQAILDDAISNGAIRFAILQRSAHLQPDSVTGGLPCPLCGQLSVDPRHHLLHRCPLPVMAAITGLLAVSQLPQLQRSPLHWESTTRCHFPAFGFTSLPVTGRNGRFRETCALPPR